MGSLADHKSSAIGGVGSLADKESYFWAAMEAAVTGQSMVKQGDGTWAPGSTALTGIRKAAAGNDVFSSGVTGDTNDRFVIRADGTMWWGLGNGAPDTSIYRYGVATIRTSGEMLVDANLRARRGADGQAVIGSTGPGGKAGIYFGSAGDTGWYRDAADIMKTEDTVSINGLITLVWNTGFVSGTNFTADSSNGNGYFQAREQSSDPAAPSTDSGRIFFKDNGAGKTQLCVRFATGAVQVIATEP